MPKDYGYFGKGSSGYAHYMQSFIENNGGGLGGGGGGDGSGCFIAILVVIVVLALLGVK